MCVNVNVYGIDPPHEFLHDDDHDETDSYFDTSPVRPASPGVQNVQILALALVPRPPFNDELRRFYPCKNASVSHREEGKVSSLTKSFIGNTKSLVTSNICFHVVFSVFGSKRPRGLFSRFSTLIINYPLECVARCCSPDEPLRALLALIVTTTILSFPPPCFECFFREFREERLSTIRRVVWPPRPPVFTRTIKDENNPTVGTSV